MPCAPLAVLLTIYHSPLTTHHSPLTTHHSPLTTYQVQFKEFALDFDNLVVPPEKAPTGLDLMSEAQRAGMTRLRVAARTKTLDYNPLHPCTATPPYTPHTPVHLLTGTRSST